MNLASEGRVAVHAGGASAFLRALANTGRSMQSIVPRVVLLEKSFTGAIQPPAHLN